MCSSIQNCTLNDAQVYSLTKEFNILPSSSLTAYDWSIDGCYYLHGIQTVRANLLLTDVDYNQAIDLCRQHCQIKPAVELYKLFSYFISRKKSCYCLPVFLGRNITRIGLRKPLMHCSFLPYIYNAYLISSTSPSNNYENLFCEINSDTVIKIDVQLYCSSTNTVSFMYDRFLHMCFKVVSLDTRNTYSTYADQACSPIQINTREQWNYLVTSSFLSQTPTYIWILPNSTYIFDDLFKLQNTYQTNVTLTSSDLCIVVVVSQTSSNKLTSVDLLPCTRAGLSSNVLCAQKAFEITVENQDEFTMTNNEQQLSVADDFTCPSEFVLFNGMCYFVHTSFVDNIQDGEHICHTQYSNSNLVKFDSHEWGNVNATQFLGRSLDDTLLEFFYYQLEKTLTLESTNNNNNNNNNNTNKKHWLRLLIGDKMQTNECVLRYFNRSFGAFTFFRSCNESGYPVCQSKTIRREIPKPILVSETINNISQTKNDSQVDFNTEPFITTSATETILPVSSNYTDLIISSNETILSQLKSPHSSPLRLITITGALLALIIFIVGSIFLGRYLRRSRGSYSTRSSIVGLSRRTKHSSTTRPSSDIPNTPAVLYARLQSSPPPTDTDMSVPFDNKLLIDGRVELLPISTNQTRNIQNSKIEEEEPLYATLKEHDEK